MPLNLAVISGQDFIQTIVWIVIVALIFWLLNWLIAYCSVQEPFAKILRVVLAVAAVLFVINVLLGLGGHAPVVWSK